MSNNAHVPGCDKTQRTRGHCKHTRRRPIGTNCKLVYRSRRGRPAQQGAKEPLPEVRRSARGCVARSHSPAEQLKLEATSYGRVRKVLERLKTLFPENAPAHTVTREPSPGNTSASGSPQTGQETQRGREPHCVSDAPRDSASTSARASLRLPAEAREERSTPPEAAGADDLHEALLRATESFQRSFCTGVKSRRLWPNMAVS